MAAQKTVQRRTKRPESRRQELLDAALKMFVERGVSAPTVADITEAAGAAKGTFYRYFESKDDLVAALQDDYTNELCDLLVRRMGEVADKGRWAQVQAFVEAASEFYLNNADVHHLLFRAQGGSHADLGEMHTQDAGAQPYHLMRELIEGGVNEGVFACEDVELTTYLLFSALHAALDLELAGAGMGHERLSRGMLDLFVKAMQPAPSVGIAVGGRSRTRRRAIFGNGRAR